MRLVKVGTGWINLAHVIAIHDDGLVLSVRFASIPNDPPLRLDDDDARALRRWLWIHADDPATIPNSFG